jgi:hypothetical protein
MSDGRLLMVNVSKAMSLKGVNEVDKTFVYYSINN